MDILGDRRFLEIPGSKLHELPPLLVRTNPNVKRLDRVVNMASEIVQSEDLVSESTIAEAHSELDLERRTMDLAINLVEQYLSFVATWHWAMGSSSGFANARRPSNSPVSCRICSGPMSGRTQDAAAS